MVLNPGIAATETWRRLTGYEELPRGIEGVHFTEGTQADTPETGDAARSWRPRAALRTAGFCRPGG